MRNRISEDCLAEVERELQMYMQVCERGLQKENAIKTYQRYASYFVRWMRGDFTPGENIPKR